MRLFIFLILVLTVLASHRHGEERLANIITRLQSVFEETVSDKRPAPALEVNLSGGIAGGIEVIETVQNIFGNLPVMTFLKTQTATVNKLVSDMRNDADAYIKVIGNKYFKFLTRLELHITMIEKVGIKLIELAKTSWLSCGLTAATILRDSYTKETQDEFTKFLDEAIIIAESITTDLENIKVEVHQLQEEAITIQHIIRQHFEDEISILNAQKKKKEKLMWLCIIPPACIPTVIAIEEIKKKIERNKRYIRNLSADLIDDFENAEEHATVVVEILKKWIPQSEALRVALSHTASVQGGLLPTLEASYLEDHPDQAGIQNTYLTRLFMAMQGLQIAAEGLEGFSIADVVCTGITRVPDYPTQHQVCACQTIKVDDWMKSKQCIDGAGVAMQDIENFPFCRLKDVSCRNEIENFLPNVCKNGLGWPKEPVAGYGLGPPGGTCYTGLFITTFQECITAVNKLGIIRGNIWDWDVPETTYVYGCSIKPSENNMIHFNTNENGQPRNSENPVCKTMSTVGGPWTDWCNGGKYRIGGRIFDTVAKV